MRFENDMVTTFFDNVSKLSDHFTFTFIEELKKDVRYKSVIIVIRLKE